jgi:ubiquinone/menaquinone biosynthesis C-methylase UbiE
MTATVLDRTQGLAAAPPLALQCPKDRARLTPTPESYVCPVCSTRYPIEDGVVRVLAETDAFYEGAFVNQIFFMPKARSFFAELPLWVIANGYLWNVRRFVPRGAKVVEMGCAAGVNWFGATYQMTGLDVSHGGLAIARKKYHSCVQAADLASIPDASLDAVISSYFWEHMTADVKEKLTADFVRVLKPGGKIVFLYDVETKNPVITWIRRLKPDLYKALFLDADGHLGYETIDVNEQRFVRHGFEIIRSNPMERTPLQGTSVFKKMEQWGGVPKLIARLTAFLDWPIVAKPYWVFLRLIDETVGRLFPRSWGRIAITVARRPIR